MSHEELKGRIHSLEVRVDDLLNRLDKQTRGGKDRWDKIGAISTFLSSVVIAGAATWFTISYQSIQLDQLAQQQKVQLSLQEHRNQLQELEAVATFLPHLAGNDSTEISQTLSILAIRRFGNTALAAEFAVVASSSGAASGLLEIIRTPSIPEDALIAQAALEKIFQARPALRAELLEPLVVQLENTKTAFIQWSGKNTYRQVKIMRDGNLAARNLLVEKYDLIPEDLRGDADMLIEHYTHWLKYIEERKGDTEPGPDEQFPVIGVTGYPFPVGAEVRFRERLELLKTDLESLRP